MLIPFLFLFEWAGTAICVTNTALQSTTVVKCHYLPSNIRPKWRTTLSMGIWYPWRIIFVTSQVRIGTLATIATFWLHEYVDVEFGLQKWQLEFSYPCDNQTVSDIYCAQVNVYIGTAWFFIKTAECLDFVFVLQGPLKYHVHSHIWQAMKISC